jgi:hypothetical protein
MKLKIPMLMMMERIHTMSHTIPPAQGLTHRPVPATPQVEKRAALRKATNSVLEFHDLAFLNAEKLPPALDAKLVPPFVDCGFGDDSVQDRQRNRYMAFGAVTKLAEKYDWLWRLAPDGVLTENITSDPFVALASTGKRYGYLTTIKDDARCTKGLWAATGRFINDTGLQTTFFHVLPQDTAFYNGFQISHSSLWTSAEFRQYFEHLDREGGMFYYRWNDANIHTLALSLFTPAEEIAVLTDVGYKHWPFIQQRTNRHVIKKPLAMAVDGLAYKVEPARELNKLFAPRRYGYLGTDVATSFRLPPSVRYGDYAWLLGDTFIGTSTPVVRNGGTDLVHNALAFLPAGHDVSPPDVRFFWNVREDGSPAEVFSADHPDSILWPVSALSVEYEEDGAKVAKIVILCQHVQKKHDLMEFLVAGGMNFEVVGTVVVVVENANDSPGRWRIRKAVVPGTDSNHNWSVITPISRTSTSQHPC